MIYSISKGVLSKDTGEVILEHCYAGGDHGKRPDAVNNPTMCSVRPDVGPLPMGKYTVGPYQPHCAAVSSPAFELIPDPKNSMFGGSGFYIHYANPTRDAGRPPYPPTPGRNSSDGCIVSVTPGSLLSVGVVRAAGESNLTVGE